MCSRRHLGDRKTGYGHRLWHIRGKSQYILLGVWPLDGWWCPFLRVTEEEKQDSGAGCRFDFEHVEFEELWK